MADTLIPELFDASKRVSWQGEDGKESGHADAILVGQIHESDSLPDLPGVGLAHHRSNEEAKRPTGQDVWIRYVGPHHGEGWKNLATGQIVYGGAQPNAEDTTLQQRAETTRQMRMKHRQERPPPSLSREMQKQGEAQQLGPQLQKAAQKAGNALREYHKGQMGQRVQELAHLAGMAYAKLPENRADLKVRLRQLLTMFARMDEQGKEREPQRDDFFPRRGTS
jgi:hypothetical protein